MQKSGFLRTRLAARIRKNEAEQPLEKVGAELRKLYSWNDTDKLINN